MLRPALIPESGNVFVAADWSAIEARMSPWLSGSSAAEPVLDVFRQGRDIYKMTGAGMFGVAEDAVTDDQRQLAKVATLACGFGGGLGAFAAMGRVYGVQLPESDARRTVDAWRRANPWAVRFWQQLEAAYTRAVRYPGREFTAGRVTYLFQGEHLWYALPSGRILCYPYARLEDDGVTYAKASWKPKADAKEWPRARLWNGLACENVTQAASNCVLRGALRELHAKGLRTVLHVHDEIVVECRESDAEAVAQEMTRLMCATPAWAPGLPLKTKPEILARYGKP